MKKDVICLGILRAKHCNLKAARRRASRSGQVKVNVDLYSALSCSKALRYGTRSQGISQFYLHTPRTSANGMNHCLCLPSGSWRDLNENLPKYLL